MALVVIGETCCSLCGEILQEHEARRSYSMFAAPADLVSHVDTSMHVSCHAAWPRRFDFDRAYEVHQRELESWASEQRTRHEASRTRVDPVVARDHAAVMATIRERGATCPHCGVHAHDYREFSSTPPTKVLCDACKRVVSPFDLKT